jgi:uncharacterized protein (TIGR00730 family)
MKNKHKTKIDDAWQVLRIQGEFIKGFDQLSELGPCISIFGSARTNPDNPHYKKAEALAKLCTENGYGVITGGGPGIMEAGNKGAYKSEEGSVGLKIQLPFEAEANDYIDELVDCRYFFTRKVFFLKYSQAFVAFPGGFGTFDELFETLTLIQTGHMRRVPIVLVGKDYWGGLVDWIEKTVLGKEKNISKEDLDLYKLVDTPEEAMEYMLDKLDSSDTNF